MAGSETVQITMPQMGESVSEGTVLTWHKQEGDWVDKDETVVEVSTDKVDAEIPAPAAGKLGKILVGEDETVAVGAALGEIELGAPDGKPTRPPEPKEETAAGDGAATEEAAASEPATATKGVSEADRDQAAATRALEQAPIGDGEKITPVARRVAAAHGIDPSVVSGSGAGGRIVKEDVLAYTQ